MSTQYSLEKRPANKTRRPELATDDSWIRAFLKQATIGYVATVWEDQPFINSTTFWYDEVNERIIFHSNVSGRVRANSQQQEKVCFTATNSGQLLPSNVALEFSIQYESVVVFGWVKVLAEPEEKRQALYGLIAKYFAQMSPGRDYRPITDQELKQTSVYAITIDSWSGKRNWPDQADQSPDWPPLAENS